MPQEESQQSPDIQLQSFRFQHQQQKQIVQGIKQIRQQPTVSPSPTEKSGSNTMDKEIQQEGDHSHREELHSITEQSNKTNTENLNNRSQYKI